METQQKNHINVFEDPFRNKINLYPFEFKFEKEMQKSSQDVSGSKDAPKEPNLKFLLPLVIKTENVKRAEELAKNIEDALNETYINASFDSIRPFVENSNQIPNLLAGNCITLEIYIYEKDQNNVQGELTPKTVLKKHLKPKVRVYSLKNIDSPLTIDVFISK